MCLLPFCSAARSAMQAPTASNAAASSVQRGKDGHLTLGLSNDDFFKDPLSVSNAQRQGSGGFGNTPKAAYGGNSGPFGGFGGGLGAPKPADVEPLAQKKFANAKAISSRCGLGAGCRCFSAHGQHRPWHLLGRGQ